MGLSFAQENQFSITHFLCGGTSTYEFCALRFPLMPRATNVYIFYLLRIGEFSRLSAMPDDDFPASFDALLLL